ncbi:molybdate ABC transporter substrate-binding protein [Aquimarina sp. ERC-38]|uniref:molybdate ABC transporter substrate-binding protein n=1 Tax=Aquimarina sp. ERC-38 TaxID=2949996 RepID=UPI0022452A12|nr:molybdate ABC transporter substrate-binding protein [Aquimarina sp. ERC-38]UZO81149.1 molybdate ABC transporter substrate-binding protein [Aquimarina sp. ERC-38]
MTIIRIFFKYQILSFIIFLFIGCQSNKKEEVLRIATASNTQFVIKKLIKKFTNKTGITCELIVGSSGKHTAQILQGAPYHLFLSADQQYPQTIYKKGMTNQPPVTYAYGQLVLWSTNKKINVTPDELTHPMIKRIVIPNPEVAPYGSAAIAFLKHQSLYEKVKSKLVYAESISQANHFILTGAVSIGFTSLSTVLAKDIETKGTWIKLPDTSYPPIAQDLVITTKEEVPVQNAQKFINFILSEEAGIILKDFGYLLPTR